jgi:anion-transporting  ArsA/GET3 family ATPase
LELRDIAGHTLRLLSLPKAWTGFLNGNDRGASCLGPHSGLKMQEARFKAALGALSNPAKTTVILVTRPDEPYAWVLNKSVLAARTRDSLLTARLAGERKQMERMACGLAKRIFALAWLTVPPIGFAELARLVSKASMARVRRGAS